MKIYLGSDTYLELGDELKLQDTANGTPIAGATVTADLFDQKTGATIVLALVLNDVGGEAGLYRGTIEDTQTGLTLKQRVRVEVTADAGPNQKLRKDGIAIVVRAE